MFERLPAEIALMLFKVSSQMFPHRLIRCVRPLTNLALNPVMFSMLKNVQAQFILCIKVPAFIITNEILWRVLDIVPLKMSCRGKP